MKLKFTGIEIDLTFANINQDDITTLKEEDLMKPECL